MNTGEEPVGDAAGEASTPDQPDQVLIWDPQLKEIRMVRPGGLKPEDEVLKLVSEDVTLCAVDADPDVRIVVLKESLPPDNGDETVPLRFRKLDDGQVYSAIGAENATDVVPGSFCWRRCDNSHDNIPDGPAEDVVRVRVRSRRRWPDAQVDRDAAELPAIEGYVRHGRNWKKVSAEIVSIRPELFARHEGLLESDLVRPACVTVIGSGSMGSEVGKDIGQLGVGHLFLADHERLALSNVMRHVAGIADVGRFKTRVVADAIRAKNPEARVETSEQKVTWETRDLMRSWVEQSDVVVCAADDRDARLMLNRICVELNKPLILAGAFSRAYGVQVLRVRPRQGPCYQCFLMSLPPESQSEGVMAGQRAAYANRPLVAEPGLANDIAPMNQMTVKLVLQELLAGKETTLHSLDQDLVASLYLWLNRREAGTEYAALEPLGFNVNGLHILRWYGVDMPRREDCPCCGDYTGIMARKMGLQLNPLDDRSPAAEGRA